MNTLIGVKFRWVVFLATSLYFVGAPDIIYDMYTLDKIYQEMHNFTLNNITWPLVEKLTLDIHKNLCREILIQITPPSEDFNNYTYDTPEAATIRKSRVIRKAPLFFHRIGVEYVPVIVCKYVECKIYLTHGDDKHVFQLARDNDNIFSFKSGPHPINIKFE